MTTVTVEESEAPDSAGFDAVWILQTDETKWRLTKPHLSTQYNLYIYNPEEGKYFLKSRITNPSSPRRRDASKEEIVLEKATSFIKNYVSKP